MPLDPAPTQDITLSTLNKFTQRWIVWFQKLVNRVNSQNIWAYYQDSQYTSGSPLSVLGGVRTQVPINKLGTVTTEQYLNGFAPSLWVSNEFLPVSVGETYILRFDFTCVPGSANQHIEIQLQVAPGDVIFSDVRNLPKGSGVAHSFEITIPVWAGQTFVNNGGALYVTPSGNCSFYGMGIYISRISVP